MSHVKRNIVANFAGSGWSALMGVAFIPVYVRYVGMEAYGLIGVYAIIQAWLMLLEVGMTPAITREMARFSGGAHSLRFIYNLLRSVEILCFSIAAPVCLGLWAASGYLSSNWLKAEMLPVDVVSEALSLISVVVALRFFESVYHGSLIGLQRQVLYNGASTFIATLRHGGAVVVLAYVSPTIQAFFLWQAICSALSVAILAISVYRALPTPSSPPKFSRLAIAEVWKFAGGMMGIAFLAVTLTQVDKVILSRVLTLEGFGIYTLAGTVSSVLYMAIVPITQAGYPHLVELASKGDRAGLISAYHQFAQMITVLTAPATMLLACFAGGSVFLWSGNVLLAESTAPILSILTLGTFLNGLMYLPYQLQLAHGWTTLSLKANMIAVAAVIPAILLAVPTYGAVGAAWIWVLLNAGYILVSVQLMHRKLISAEKWNWYVGDVLLPATGALSVTLLAMPFQPAGYQDRLQWFVFLLLTGGGALGTSIALAARLRAPVLSAIQRVLCLRPW